MLIGAEHVNIENTCDSIVGRSLAGSNRAVLDEGFDAVGLEFSRKDVGCKQVVACCNYDQFFICFHNVVKNDRLVVDGKFQYVSKKSLCEKMAFFYYILYSLLKCGGEGFRGNLVFNKSFKIILLRVHFVIFKILLLTKSMTS